MNGYRFCILFFSRLLLSINSKILIFVHSSNYGLVERTELNVQIRGPEVDLLQEWYDRHWEVAEEVTPDLLRILERHTNPVHPLTSGSRHWMSSFAVAS